MVTLCRVLKAASSTLEIQGDITLANGTILPFTNTATVNGANFDAAEDFKFFTTFSVASANNSITLRTLTNRIEFISTPLPPPPPTPTI